MMPKMLTLKQFLKYHEIFEGKYIKQISSKLSDAIINELENKYVDYIMKQEPVEQAEDDYEDTEVGAEDKPAVSFKHEPSTMNVGNARKDKMATDYGNRKTYNREDLKGWVEKYLLAYYEKGPKTHGELNQSEDEDQSILTKYGTSVAVLNIMKAIGIPSQLMNQSKKWESIEDFEEVLTNITEKKMRELGLKTPIGQ